MKRMWSKKEVKSIVEQGALNIEGPLTIEKYEFDEDITLNLGENSLNPYYAHARVSNGKLNIVIALVHQTNAETINYDTGASVGAITLPANVLEKLSPAYGTALDRVNLNMYSYLASENIEIPFLLEKSASGIDFKIGQSSSLTFSANNYVGRLEINFTL